MKLIPDHSPGLVLTPMRVAISVTGVEPHRVAVAKFHGSRLEGCLATFDRETRLVSQRDFARAMSSSQANSIQVEYRDALKLARGRLPGSILLRDLQLDFWPAGTEPLPLELAKVVATSVLRHFQSGGDVDSVFDAAKAKLANDRSRADGEKPITAYRPIGVVTAFDLVWIFPCSHARLVALSLALVRTCVAARPSEAMDGRSARSVRGLDGCPTGLSLV